MEERKGVAGSIHLEQSGASTFENWIKMSTVVCSSLHPLGSGIT